MKAVFFIGLSGVGKSALMRALTSYFPDRFVMPQRWTTRKPKVGDLNDEVHCISEEEFDLLESKQRLLFIMKQNALDSNSPRSAYPKTVLNQSHIPLLFCSVFSLQQVDELRRLYPHIICVHIKAPWTEGLKLRGGKTQSSRTKLNQDVHHCFTEEALQGLVDFHFEHHYQGIKEASMHLAARISEYFATHSSMNQLKAGQTLGRTGFYWISGNVRLAHKRLEFPLHEAQLHTGKVHRGDIDCEIDSFPEIHNFVKINSFDQSSFPEKLHDKCIGF